MAQKHPKLETIVAWIVMVWIPVLLTAACGFALIVQDREFHDQAHAAVKACTEAADTAAATDPSSRIGAYAVCMDDRAITRPESVTAPQRQPG
jgi:hypothetical protein